MPLGRRQRVRRRRVAAAAAGAYAVHRHEEHKREEQEQQEATYRTEPTALEQEEPVGQEAGSPDDSVGQLTQLKSLLDSGALTQQEFDAEKQKIIGA
jgi:hypothetical protein